MLAGGTDNQLVHAVALLGAAVVLVPLFRRLGLGSVLGYLTAGLLVGPFGLGWFTDPEAILHLAELGVVMFLFVVGLEMEPSRLWSLRQYILGLGLLQTVVSAAALTALGWLTGLPLAVAFVGALGFTLTSTAIVMQLVAERRDMTPIAGQKIISVLLLEDLLLVPLLALVAWMAPDHGHVEASHAWLPALKGLAALVALLVAGRWLLNPLFRILAQSKVREVLTAGALLVVLGAAVLMQLGGLSMAMGAFIAGVMLSESSFRHQLEADVEPFRGLLLGLFFLGVGMALDVATVKAHWAYILVGVLGMMLVKGIGIYVVARLTRSDHDEALQRASLMALGGEFAFVLFAAATAGNVMTAAQNATFTAAVVLSMAIAPLVEIAVRKLAGTRATAPPPAASDVPEGLSGSVLMIGFGRFGQVVSQPLLARDVEVTVIDTDIEMIQAASGFGFRIYYGDGTRLDVLEAAGAARAQVIAVCVDSRATVDRILDVALHEFPQARWIVRTYDREHSREVVGKGVSFHVRETFESALAFGTLTLRKLGVSSRETKRIADVVRAGDAKRFEQEIAGVDWATAGSDVFVRRSQPVPLTPPRHPSQPLNQQAEMATRAKP